MNSYLYNTMIYWVFTMVLVFLIFAFDSPFELLMAALSGASFLGGLINLSHYYHWKRPENRKKAIKRERKWKSDSRAKIKKRLDNEANRISYKISLFITSLAILTFIVLDSLNFVDNALIFVLFLLAYLTFQYFIKYIIYRKLIERYELNEEKKNKSID